MYNIYIIYVCVYFTEINLLVDITLSNTSLLLRTFLAFNVEVLMIYVNIIVSSGIYIVINFEEHINIKIHVNT